MLYDEEIEEYNYLMGKYDVVNPKEFIFREFESVPISFEG